MNEDNIVDAMRMRIVAIAFLLGAPSYLFCSVAHVCMAGHMQHPPYPLWQWISDGLWFCCFLLAVGLSIRLKARKQRWFFYGAILLVISRYIGSMGGTAILLETPLLLYLSFLAVRFIVCPRRYSLS
jgi:hypothetical protein